MLTDFDDRTLVCAARLLANEDHTTLIDWYEQQSTEIAREGMKLQDIETVRWYQGACQVLDELVGKLKEARDLAESKANLPGLPKGEIV